jgi:hypothetical protein
MTFTISDNVVHAVQATVSGSTGTVYVDSGAAQTGSVSPANVAILSIGQDGDFYWNGPLFEIGFWDTPTTFSSTDASKLNSNQHAHWGF